MACANDGATIQLFALVRAKAPPISIDLNEQGIWPVKHAVSVLRITSTSKVVSILQRRYGNFLLGVPIIDKSLSCIDTPSHRRLLMRLSFSGPVAFENLYELSATSSKDTLYSSWRGVERSETLGFPSALLWLSIHSCQIRSLRHQLAQSH